MFSGVLSFEKQFWEDKLIDSLYFMYTTLSCNPAKVIDRIVEPVMMNSNQS